MSKPTQNEPVEFFGQNFIYRCGPIPNCQPLPCFVDWGAADPSVTSCWQLTEDDLAVLNANGGRIYVRTYGEVPPPVFVTSQLPFSQADQDRAAIYGPPSLTMAEAIELDKQTREAIAATVAGQRDQIAQKLDEMQADLDQALNPEYVQKAIAVLAQDLAKRLFLGYNRDLGIADDQTVAPLNAQHKTNLGVALWAYFLTEPDETPDQFYGWFIGSDYLDGRNTLDATKASPEFTALVAACRDYMAWIGTDEALQAYIIANAPRKSGCRTYADDNGLEWTVTSQENPDGTTSVKAETEYDLFIDSANSSLTHGTDDAAAAEQLQERGDLGAKPEPATALSYEDNGLAYSVAALGRIFMDAIAADQAGVAVATAEYYPTKYVKSIGTAASSFYKKWPDLLNAAEIRQLVHLGGEYPHLDRDGGEALLDAMSDYVNRPDRSDLIDQALADAKLGRYERLKELGFLVYKPDGSLTAVVQYAGKKTTVASWGEFEALVRRAADETGKGGLYKGNPAEELPYDGPEGL